MVGKARSVALKAAINAKQKDGLTKKKMEKIRI
jgi:hypothetical protein